MIIGTAGQETETAAVLLPPEPIVSQNDLQRLYTEHWRAVFALAYRVTGNASDAEDAMQTVFVRLLANRATLDGSRSPEGYLRRSAVNASIDILRHRRVLGETGLTEHRASDNLTLEKEGLRRALAKLDPEDAELFTLCYLEGYTYEELADLFQVERGTVASRLFRIREELRDRLSR